MSPAPGPDVNVKLPTRGDGVRRRHALVIGIDGYRDRALALPFCAADAIRLGEVLAARGFQVTALHDRAGARGKPTLANVQRALAAVMKAADADDLVLVFFSGHGRLVGGRPHLMLADTPNTDDGLASRGLPLATLLAALRGEPRWVAIFLDVCHMGLGLDPSASRSTEHGAERAGGFALLAGSTSGQITQDTTGAGVFSKSVIEGIAGAAADPDGAVRFSALARHVQDEVARWRRSDEGRTKLATQTPVLRLEVADLELLPPHDYLDLAPPHAAKIRAAAWSPDGLRLATVSEDGSLRLSDPATGAPVLEPMWHGGHVGGVAFAADGGVIATACNDGFSRVWQTSGGNLVEPPPATVDTLVHAVAWAPDRRAWVAAAQDGLHVYPADAIGRPRGHRPLSGHAGPVWAVAFAPDGTLYSGGEDGTVRAWDLRTGRPTRAWTMDGPVWAVAVSPDGARVAAAGADARPADTLANVPRVWDRTADAPRFTLRGHRGGVTAIAFSRAGDRLATSSYDGSARVWRAGDGALERELTIAVDQRAHRPAAYGACFAPDGGRLFVGYADGRGRIFRLSPPR